MVNKKATNTIDKSKLEHRKTAVSKSKETRSLPSHDKLYRRLFAHPEMVEDLVKTFVKERFVKGVDFSTLKELKNKYVTDENKYRENDIIYEIKIKNETLYFYILLEFQSTVDKFMPVRMLRYIGIQNSSEGRILEALVQRPEGVGHNAVLSGSYKEERG